MTVVGLYSGRSDFMDIPVGKELASSGSTTMGTADAEVYNGVWPESVVFHVAAGSSLSFGNQDADALTKLYAIFPHRPLEALYSACLKSGHRLESS